MNNWVVLKTKHSKTKTEARSTQISKTKHPNLENGAPKPRKRSTQTSKTKHPNLKNEAPKTWKRSTQDSKTKHPNLENEAPKSWNHCTLKVYNFFKSCMTQAKPGGGNESGRTFKGLPIHPTEHWFLAWRSRAVSTFHWAFFSCHPFVYISVC